GFKPAAVEAYRIAAETEPPFVLPIVNAFSALEQIGEPALAEPFIRALQTRWDDSPTRTLLLARGHHLAGRPGTAAMLACAVIAPQGIVQPPEAVFELTHDASDKSVFGAPDMAWHYDFALALLQARRFDDLHSLARTIADWPRWRDGDWRVIDAE